MSTPTTDASESRMNDCPSPTTRAYWVALLSKMAHPLLAALAEDRLKVAMPIEARTGELAALRRRYSHLEGFARLLSGLSPWLELADDGTPEGETRMQLAGLAKQALANAVDPKAQDFLNFSDGDQPLVDAAHLALALLRGPSLWFKAEPTTRRHIVEALKSTRLIKPGYYNWLLYSALIEAFFLQIGEDYDRVRIDYALRQHDLWYKGDGAFGDGPEFRWDYYNSFSIQPLLRTVLAAISDLHTEYADMRGRFDQISARYVMVLERLIAEDGSFPALGRSIVYRCGAFQHLANEARLQRLPAELPPGQARTALSAVIAKTLGAAGTFDADGWLRLGLCGHQPNLAEDYISTGSLYMAALAFLPLGLPAHDPFWADDPVPFSAQKLWAGCDDALPDVSLRFFAARREDGYWADGPVYRADTSPTSGWSGVF